MDRSRKGAGKEVSFCCAELNMISDQTYGVDIHSVIKSLEREKAQNKSQPSSLLLPNRRIPKTHKESLQSGKQVGNSRSDYTNEDSRTRSHESSGGSDGHETANSTGAESYSGPLALEAEIEEHPTESTHAGGEVGVDDGETGLDVGGCRGAEV